MCTTLYDAANSFVHQHFVEVSVSEEFLALNVDEVLELVGCDELNVKAEEQVRGKKSQLWKWVARLLWDLIECISGYARCTDYCHNLATPDLATTDRHELSWCRVSFSQVFEAVLTWVRHQREDRESCLPELLSKTRLPLCRPQFLADRVQQDELVRCCHKCRFDSRTKRNDRRINNLNSCRLF